MFGSATTAITVSTLTKNIRSIWNLYYSNLKVISITAREEEELPQRRRRGVEGGGKATGDAREGAGSHRRRGGAIFNGRSTVRQCRRY